MTATSKKRFLVMYQIPAAQLDAWMKTDPKTREASEAKLRGEWDAWTKAHAMMIVDSNAGGKTKRVTAGGIAPTRNDIVICATIEGDDHETVAKLFASHPHLQIPHAMIDIMELRPMTAM